MAIGSTDTIRITVPGAQALRLIMGYVRRCLKEQLRAIWLIVSYLIVFQTLVLGVPVAQAVRVAAGLAIVLFGLAFFFEGLLLGLMPLSETIGIKLPHRAGIPAIAFFACILGVGATFAEPAINILRTAGSSVPPWEAPLLYMLLNTHAGMLVWAVALGVGAAVILGVLRLLFGWPLKPLIFLSVFITFGLSVGAHTDPRLRTIIGLAWDCGGVTTGPVTVPLVLALGLGICRVSGKSGVAAGFGVVTLASLLPVSTVLVLGMLMVSQAPMPMSEAVFMSQQGHAAAVTILGGEQEFAAFVSGAAHVMSGGSSLMELARNGAIISLRAVGPLVMLLLLVLLLMRERLRRVDEVALGVVFTLIGMALFTTGIDMGLTPIGTQAGRYLPAAFKEIPVTELSSTIPAFDTSVVQKALQADGSVNRYFQMHTPEGYRSVPFDASAYNHEQKAYRVTPVRGPLFNRRWGLLLVLLFALVMGYGATLAEPALNALGRTVEELTVGSLTRSALVQTVATGVGVGMVFGMIKIVWDVPLLLLLMPPYALAVILTVFSEDDFVNIAWDSAGVTTGPITVPLVIALGLGMGNQMGAMEGFGILAMASVWPILLVLAVGLFASHRALSAIRDSEAVPDGESLS